MQNDPSKRQFPSRHSGSRSQVGERAGKTGRTGKTKSLLAIAICAFWLVAGIGSILAQNRSSSEITGQVTDQTGAALPAVHVTVQNIATGVSVSKQTNGAGVYDLPLLQPGTYTVTFSKDGFETAQRQNITLEIDQTAHINIGLPLGESRQTVVVEAAPPLLTTDNSQVETVMDSELTHELPLVGRTPTQLAALAPGTSTAQSDVIGTGSGGLIDPGRVNVGGARTFTIAPLLNGGPVILPNSNNFGNMIPSLDAISEFSVIEDNFGAQYGNGTSVLNMIIKNGTNRFHGSVYEFNENDAMNATAGFATSKPKLRYNQFGGSIGGPIIKNKLFFFFSYENTLSPSSAFHLITVPPSTSMEDSSGNWNFSSFLAANGNDNNQPIILYDPTTGKPFPNNTIPASRIDSVAKAVLAYWPAPNYGSAGAASNNYGRLAANTPRTPIYDARGDWTISPKHQLYVALHDEPYYALGQGYIPGPACYGGENCGPSVTFDQAYQADEKWTLTPNATNDLNAGYIREHYANTPENYGGNYPSKLGLKANGINQLVFPSFTFDGAIPTSLGPGSYYEGFQNVFTYADIFLWVKGKHTVQIGGQYSAQQFDIPSYFGPPSFTFNGQYTGNNGQYAGTQSPGIGFADFLLGDVQSYSYNATPIEFGGRRKSAAAFIQDDWKITPTLVLNLGLRYQYEGTWTEAHNNTSNFSPTAINSATDTPGAILFATSSHPYIQQNHAGLFAPRVGFAKSIQGNMAIRGGFGIYYEPLGAGTNFNGNSPGYSITQTLISQTLTSPPVFQLQNGPPAYVVPTAADRTGAVGNGQSISWWPQNARQTYEEQWNLSVERQFGRSSTAQISYVGSRGLHLLFWRDANQVPLSAQGSAEDRTNPQVLRLFPQYQGISTTYNDASSNFNALEVIVKRKFSGGLTLFSTYTLGRSLDTSSSDQTTGVGSEYQVTAKPSLNYAVSNFNQTHRLTAAYVLQLPIGQGKKFLNTGGITNAILGGWQNSGSLIAHSGAPFTVYGSGTQTTGLLAGSLFGNCIGNSSGPKTSTEWMNTSAFADPASYSIGTCSRDSVVGPGGWDFDLSLAKEIQLWRSMKFQFRADAFNVFNHRWLSLPNSTIGSGAFGQITSSSPPRILEVGGHISF